MAGAIVMGVTVFCINYFITYVAFDSMIASIKQASYTFLLGGFFMKGAEYIAVYVKKYSLAIFLAVFIPSTITILLTYGMHLVKGTPAPLASTIPTLAIVPATLVWSIKKRKYFFKQKLN
jgi:hypothetical protein